MSRRLIMKTKKILKILQSIEEKSPPRTKGLFSENFAKIIFYSDGSGHIEINEKEIISFGHNFDYLFENYTNWITK